MAQGEPLLLLFPINVFSLLYSVTLQLFFGVYPQIFTYFTEICLPLVAFLPFLSILPVIKYVTSRPRPVKIFPSKFVHSLPILDVILYFSFIHMQPRIQRIGQHPAVIFCRNPTVTSIPVKKGFTRRLHPNARERKYFA